MPSLKRSTTTAALVLLLTWAPSLPATGSAEGHEAATSDPDTRTLEERCRAEVVELHEFLEAWSNAELPPTDEAFARFAAVLASDFVIIGPDGERAGREPVVAAIRGAHGRWQDNKGTIRIESFELHHAAGGLALATYEEWHELGETRGRLSTVLFGPAEGAPNGLEWLHLHEVWLEASETGDPEGAGAPGTGP